MKFKYNVFKNIYKMYLIIIVFFVITSAVLSYFTYIDLTAYGNGIVEAKEWAEIRPKANGIISEVLVEEGQRVEKGETLFVITGNNKDVKLSEVVDEILDLQTNIKKVERKIKVDETEENQNKEELYEELTQAEVYLSSLINEKEEKIHVARRGIQYIENKINMASKSFDLIKENHYIKPLLQKVQLEKDIISNEKKLHIYSLDVKNKVEEATYLLSVINNFSNYDIEKLEENETILAESKLSDFEIKKLRSNLEYLNKLIEEIGVFEINTKDLNAITSNASIYESELKKSLSNIRYLTEIYAYNKDQFESKILSFSEYSKSKYNLIKEIDQANLIKAKIISTYEALLKDSLARTREIESVREELEKQNNLFKYRVKIFNIEANEEYLTRESTLKGLRIELDNSKRELELLGRGYTQKIEQAELKLEKAKSRYNKALTEENEPKLLEKSLYSMINRLETLESKQSEVSSVEVKAPISGVVLTRNTKELIGVHVTAGSSLIRIGDISEYIIEALIPEKEFSLVRVGQNAKVEILSFPKGEYKFLTAKVIDIGTEPISEPNGNYFSPKEYPVKLALDPPYSLSVFNQIYRILPGSTASVEITTSRESIINIVLSRVLRITNSASNNGLHIQVD